MWLPVSQRAVTEQEASASSVLGRHGGVYVQPGGGAWREMVQASWSHARSNHAALALREQLGLPTDRPVVMSGHQAVLWHPGILAKWYALRAAAGAMGAAAAWVVVDHDTDDLSVVHYPGRRAGILTRAPWRWREPLGSQVPACAADARPPTQPAGDVAASEHIRSALARAMTTLRAHADEATAGRQVARATADLVGGVAPGLVYSSDMLRCPACDQILESLAADPQACVDAYNAAAVRHPEAGLRTLVADEINDRWELPLWRWAMGSPRQRVFAEELGSQLAGARLAPRAVFMTGLLRSLACDLFIHGVGGGVYDVASEQWWGRWRPADRLAGTAVVSATLHLHTGDSETDAKRVVDRARWTAHHAAHNPRVTGDEPAQARKLELARRISALPKRTAERREAFSELHEFIAQHGRRAERSLAMLRERAEEAARAGKDAADPAGRDWPFFLYPEDELRELERNIEQRVRG